MNTAGIGYDLSASQFSPDGHVFQIEYATKAVQKSGTLIGLRGKDGVVLAVEQILTSPLYEDDAGERIFTIDENIGMGFTGMLADGRHIVDVARQEATKYRQQFQRTMPVKELCDHLSGYMHAYTLYSAVRPFGVSVMLSSWEKDQGPQLYEIDPSGSSVGFFACANGKAKQQAKTELEKMTYTDMSTEDLVQNSGNIIYKVHDYFKDKDFRYGMGLVSRETEGIHRINPSPWIGMAIEAGQTGKSDQSSDEEI